jgi:hypothetical protein
MSQLGHAFLLSVEKLHQNTNVGDDYEILSLLTDMLKCLCITHTRGTKINYCLLNLNMAVSKTLFFNPLSLQCRKVEQQFRYIMLQPSR